MREGDVNGIFPLLGPHTLERDKKFTFEIQKNLVFLAEFSPPFNDTHQCQATHITHLVSGHELNLSHVNFAPQNFEKWAQRGLYV